MQCPVCHNEVLSQAAFCNHCGASLAAAAPGAASLETPVTPPPGYSEAPPAAAAPPPGSAAPPTATSTGLTPNAAAAIAYITFIPAIIFLMIEPYNKIPLVRFHSFQSIGLAVAAFVLHIAASMLLYPFGFLMHSMIQSLISLGLFIIWIIVILKASKGEWYKLPIIGDFALKQAQS